ncbi:MAG: CLC_0170 family protein [Caldanaerobacter sp.]
MWQFLHFIRQYFTVYMFVLVFIVGIYEAFIEPKLLERKGLYKDSKVCKSVGVFYILTGIIALILRILFPM